MKFFRDWTIFMNLVAPSDIGSDYISILLVQFIQWCYVNAVNIWIPSSMACFKEVGKFKVAGAALSQSSVQFPDALNYMTKGKRVIGSEPHIIRSYLDCIVKLQLLHAAVLASTVPELSMPKPIRTKSVNNLEIVPFSEARLKSTNCLCCGSGSEWLCIHSGSHVCI